MADEDLRDISVKDVELIRQILIRVDGLSASGRVLLVTHLHESLRIERDELAKQLVDSMAIEGSATKRLAAAEETIALLREQVRTESLDANNARYDLCQVMDQLAEARSLAHGFRDEAKQNAADAREAFRIADMLQAALVACRQQLHDQQAMPDDSSEAMYQAALDEHAKWRQI